MKRFFSVLVFIFSVLAMFSLNSFASRSQTQDRTVEVTGIGQSEQDALQDARRNAVREGLGAYITTETVVENFMLKYDRISAHAQGFVRDMTVLSKETTVDNLIEVRVNATVTMDDILGDKIALQHLLEALNKPRIMIVMNEKDYQGNTVSSPISESEMIRVMIDQGFSLVDQSQVNAIRESDQMRAAVSGNAEAAQVIASRFGAEILIVGDATVSARENSMLGDMKSVQAVVTMRAINSNTGSIIYSMSSTGAFPHIDPLVGGERAINRALERGFAGSFLVKVLDNFQQAQNQGIEIKLIVHGVNNFQIYKSVTDGLGEVKEIRNLARRNWNQAAGLCEYSNTYMGASAESLAEKLDGLAIGDKKLMVTDFSANSVEVRLE